MRKAVKSAYNLNKMYFSEVVGFMEKKVVNESLPYCYDRVCKSIILKDGNSTDGSVMHPEGHRCHGKLFRLVVLGQS